MKNIKMKYLELYKECVELGELPSGELADGLCKEIEKELMDLFEPDVDELKDLEKQFLCKVWWASELKVEDSLKRTILSPLRQNIILFCAAMNGEL